MEKVSFGELELVGSWLWFFGLELLAWLEWL